MLYYNIYREGRRKGGREEVREAGREREQAMV